jgi:D-aminopeptidase
MRVTVDTREDSLAQVLAVLANAYGVPLSLISSDVDLTSDDDRVTAKVGRAAASGAPGIDVEKPPAKKAARARRTPVRRHANVAPPGQARKIREWARGQGYEIGVAGRLPADVIAEYRAQTR